ncbi:RNA polymerase sigma factor [Streptomyces sp. NPDC002851]
MDTSTDDQRFTELYRRHYSAVDAYVRRRILDDQVADVVAEVFLVAWRRFGAVPTDAALPWLYGVARRTLANAYRSDKHRRRLSETLRQQHRAEVDDHAEVVTQKLGLAAAFDALSEADQDVLRLSIWDGLTAAEAAKSLGCRTATYQVRLHRARKRLQAGWASATRYPPRQGASASPRMTRSGTHE